MRSTASAKDMGISGRRTNRADQIDARSTHRPRLLVLASCAGESDAGVVWKMKAAYATAWASAGRIACLIGNDPPRS